MENMSILNLFSAKANIELPKMTAESGQGEFENVFKSYLDRSEGSAVANDKSLKYEDTATVDQRSVEAEEPETPEEVIDNLDIPEEQKAELKRMLEEAETPEDISLFIDELIGAAGDESEEVLTQLALSILSSEGERTEQEAVMLEQALDQIAAQTDKQPTLTLVKNEASQAQAVSSQQQTGQDSADSQAETASEESSDELTEEMKQRLADAKAKTAETQSKSTEVFTTKEGDRAVKTEITENGFTMKAESTEKVISTEVKIESPKDIMKFADLMELAKGQKANKLTVQLTPQELGKVNIELTEQAGKVSGRITFETETARNLFNANADGLKQQLADKGIIIENLEFVFKDFEQHEFAGWEGREGKNSSNGGGSVITDEQTEEEQEEADGIYA